MSVHVVLTLGDLIGLFIFTLVILAGGYMWFQIWRNERKKRNGIRH